MTTMTHYSRHAQARQQQRGIPGFVIDEKKAYLGVVEHSQWLREKNDRLEDLLQDYREKLIEEAKLDARETIFAPCN